MRLRLCSTSLSRGLLGRDRGSRDIQAPSGAYRTLRDYRTRWGDSSGGVKEGREEKRGNTPWRPHSGGFRDGGEGGSRASNGRRRRERRRSIDEQLEWRDLTSRHGDLLAHARRHGLAHRLAEPVLQSGAKTIDRCDRQEKMEERHAIRQVRMRRNEGEKTSGTRTDEDYDVMPPL
ncbi:hypothetical protein PMAYCL1PPCAC_04507, partial [Pristionchus mayeri]